MARYGNQGQDKGNAKRKTTTGRAGHVGVPAVGNAFRGFVSHPRTAAVKEAFENHMQTSDDYLPMVETLCGAGFKFSINWDADSDAIRVVAYSNDVSRGDCGLALSTWAPTAYEAIALCAFLIGALGDGALDHPFFTAPEDKKKVGFWE